MPEQKKHVLLLCLLLQTDLQNADEKLEGLLEREASLSAQIAKAKSDPKGLHQSLQVIIPCHRHFCAGAGFA